MGTINSKEAFNELLFENRNKNYGAYVIRKNYDRRMVVSMLMTVSFFVMAMIVPNFFGNVKKIVAATNTVTTHTLMIVDPLHPNEPPKPLHQEPVVTKKGLKGGVPTPVDTNKIVQNDSTTVDPDKIGDPKGKDTTRIIAQNPPIGGGGGGLPPKDPKIPVEVPDVAPEYPGGMEAFYAFLKDHIHYPELARDNGIKGTVYLSFIIDEEGKVSNIKNLNSLGGGLEREAIRVAGLMPDWKPGKVDGENVPVKFSIPVKFALK